MSNEIERIYTHMQDEYDIREVFQLVPIAKPIIDKDLSVEDENVKDYLKIWSKIIKNEYLNLAYCEEDKADYRSNTKYFVSTSNTLCFKFYSFDGQGWIKETTCVANYEIFLERYIYTQFLHKSCNLEEHEDLLEKYDTTKNQHDMLVEWLYRSDICY